MSFLSRFEGLTTRVTRRWQTIAPDPGGPSTAVAPPEEADDYGAYPMGQKSLAVSIYEERIKLLDSRKAKYALYDEMDSELPEYSTALDIHADNATRGTSDGGNNITIKSDNPRVSKILDEVRKDLDLDRIIWTQARDLAKYGERAEEIIVTENGGWKVSRLKPLPTLEIIPQVDAYGRTMDPAYVQVDPDDPSKETAKFKDWQVLYLANKKSRGDLHGEGLGFSSRRAFLQLRMMEDAVVIARLTRAHNRLAYMVDTGGMAPKEAQKHLKNVKEALRKRRSVDPYTGKMALDWSPLSIEEDIFVATNKDSKADVKVLQGDLTIGNLSDLEYFQQKILTSLKTPKAYLQHVKDARARAVITEADIQFARSVRRLQHIIETALRQVFDLALLLRGINPKQVTYKVHLPVISVIDELRVWQTMQLKMLVAQMFKQTLWPSDEWVLKELLGYDDEVTDRIIAGQKKPDPWNGLYQAPKIGNAPKNIATKEESLTRAETVARLSQLSEEDFSRFEEAAGSLSDIINWQLEAS
jgi:hypothetical protein